MKRESTICAWLILGAASSLAQTTTQFTAIHPLPSNEVELIWSSDTNRLFAILGTTDLHDWDNAFCAGILQPSAASNAYRDICAVDSTPCFFRVFASPPLDPSVVCHTNLGTPASDTQIVIGATNQDYVMQFGNAGGDTQYASGGAGSDWIAQYGGTGADKQHGYGGTDDDSIYQQGGTGDDTIYALGDDGADWIMQYGGEGNDEFEMAGGAGDDRQWLNGGDGDDDMKVNTGGGTDRITYDASTGLDEANMDGGMGTDALTVNENDQHVVIRLGDGTVLYSNGPPGTTITATNVEVIYVVGTNGLTNWSWTAP